MKSRDARRAMLPTLVAKVVEALRSAGATEEIIAAAVKAGGEFGHSPPNPGGRPRKHFADRAATPIERVQASRARRKSAPCFETEPNEIRDEIPRLRARLEDAAQGNFDPAADLAPIRALLDQGCDLEADILPIVARELPEFPRPLKNWGAPWLVRDILAARDQRRTHGREVMPTWLDETRSSRS